MPDSSEKINQLQVRLDKMIEYQDYFYREINSIRDELKALESNLQNDTASLKVELPTVEKPPVIKERVLPIESASKSVERPAPESDRKQTNATSQSAQVSPTATHRNSNLEEFIGIKLIVVIGIIITIFGVGIGAKYAIERDLISPATRILLGYAFAGGLLAVAFWLKGKYLNFSAVLLSGALAIMYFLTFFAYSFYDLISQTSAFALMVFFTAFAVFAAINFNRQVIAHIGLVGAYAVPFLLSDNSGRVAVLFSYMTVINIGILLISVVKFWKPLFYSSFIFTWLIYAAWFVFNYRVDENFALAFGFALIFFLTFYTTFLVYKLLAKGAFSAEIVALVLINSFVFYAFGYAILYGPNDYNWLLGLFTVANALLNALVAFIIYRYNLGDRGNFYLAAALAVTFLTIAVPVQFDGNWVTLVWTAEAALLFWFGRMKSLPIYENLSYPLMILATISLLDDWQNAFISDALLTPIFNRNFLASILFAVAFGFIASINRDGRFSAARVNAANLLSFFAPSLFLIVLYNSFRVEIGNYFHILAANSAVQVPNSLGYTDTVKRRDYDLNYFNVIWQINYSLLFAGVLSFVNIKKFKSAWLGIVNFGLNSIVLFVFLSIGLYLISELRTSYLAQNEAEFFSRGAWHILIRYVSLAFFVAALLYASYRYVKQQFLERLISNSALALWFDFIFYVALWWVVSSELINLMDIFGLNDSYKLGLSILWGIYSLFLIVLGIIKKKKHLRIGAIALFAITLIKLFFYDIADLDTISKTVIFLTLGILLLVISFLYNKYKDLIFEKSA